MKAVFAVLMWMFLLTGAAAQQSDIVLRIDFGPQERGAEGWIALADTSIDARKCLRSISVPSAKVA